MPKTTKMGGEDIQVRGKLISSHYCERCGMDGTLCIYPHYFTLPSLFIYFSACHPTSLLIFTDFFFFLPFLLAYVTQITSGLTFSGQLKLSIIYSGSTTLQVLHSFFLVNVSVLT